MDHGADFHAVIGGKFSTAMQVFFMFA